MVAFWSTWLISIVSLPLVPADSVLLGGRSFHMFVRVGRGKESPSFGKKTNKKKHTF